MTTDALLVLALGLISGFAGSALALGIALRFGILNAPNPIVPQHTRPVAYLGGIGILLGIVATYWLGSAFVTEEMEKPARQLLLPAALFGLFGALDDVRPLQPGPKLLGQILLAAIAVACGVDAEFTGVRILDIGCTMFWIVLVVNAVNFTDVCNGLVTGLGAVFFLVWSGATPSDSLFALACVGACLGFLPFNFPNARMFLGDAGSHLLGFLIAALLLRGDGNGTLGVIEMILFAIVPIFELVFITTIRIRKGLPWWRGSPDHFSLRLQAGGWSRTRINLSAWSLMAAGGALAALFPRLHAAAQIGVLAVVAVVAAACARYLLRYEVRHAVVASAPATAANAPSSAEHAGQ